MQWKRVAALAAVAGLLVVGAALDAVQDTADEDVVAGPHVIVHKGLHLPDEQYMVVGRPFTVQYSLFNQGSDAAHDVSAFDSWPEESFSVQSGSAEVRVPLLEAGTSEEFNLTLVPLNDGVFLSERATVSYTDKSSDEAGATREGFSSTFGQVTIITQDMFERATATYSAEWTIFLVLCAGPTLLPLAVWQYVKNGRKSKRS